MMIITEIQIISTPRDEVGGFIIRNILSQCASFVALFSKTLTLSDSTV